MSNSNTQRSREYMRDYMRRYRQTANGKENTLARKERRARVNIREQAICNLAMPIVRGWAAARATVLRVSDATLHHVGLANVLELPNG